MWRVEFYVGAYDMCRAPPVFFRLILYMAHRWVCSYQVVFSDVGDPLALERARALWSSLEGYAGDVVALVPRYSGQHLEDPLRDIGYR